MTQQEYEERNLRGFEGDNYIRHELERLIAKYDIELVIETGTYLGGTTKQLATMVKEVITIEINKAFFGRAHKFLRGYNNVTMLRADTTEMLPSVLADNKFKKMLILIDSHWEKECPLERELEIIAESHLEPIIAIHDFLNPYSKEFGYDTYNGKPFTFEWLKPRFDKIYGKDGYDYHYNTGLDEASAKRGIIYLEPIKL